MIIQDYSGECYCRAVKVKPLVINIVSNSGIGECGAVQVTDVQNHLFNLGLLIGKMDIVSIS